MKDNKKKRHTDPPTTVVAKTFLRCSIPVGTIMNPAVAKAATAHAREIARQKADARTARRTRPSVLRLLGMAAPAAAINVATAK